MGETGASWYRQCGWPEPKVFPYMYVTERTDFAHDWSSTRSSEESFKIVFVGQLIDRKGVDLLLRALQRLKINDWTLTIVGDGPRRQALQALARRLEIAGRVSFRPAVPNLEALRLIAAHDLLVLPSRYDGWGAVVNEALMHGVPAVSSDQCGAAALLASDWRGERYQANSVSNLAGALERSIASGSLSFERSMRIAEWSRNIEGAQVASYLVQLLAHVYELGPVPIAPWRHEDRRDRGICESSRLGSAT